MKAINKKMNELYITKKVTIVLPYRGKTREMQYVVIGYVGNQMKMSFYLKSIRYPCPIPKFENISIELENEFPIKSLLKKLKNKPKQ